MKAVFCSMLLNKHLLLFCCLVPLLVQAQYKDSTSKHWFIVLPLRFTQLQNQPTMLSGVKLGHQFTPKFAVSLSVYHSFYFKAFKAEAGLAGFTEQPRLFINAVGAELDYTFWHYKKIKASAQILVGWGFMKYDGEQYRFESKQVNYVAVEPACVTEYLLAPSTALGLGVGYRPVFTNKSISYTSDIGNGNIAVNKKFPNGVNVLLSLKGIF